MFIEYTVPRSTTYMKTGHGHAKKEKPSLRTVHLVSKLFKYRIEILYDNNDMLYIKFLLL